MTTFVPLSQDTEGAVSSASLGDWVLGIIKVRSPSKTASYYSQLLDQFQEVDGEQVIKEAFQLFELLLSENMMIFEFLADAKEHGSTPIQSIDQSSKAETEVSVKYLDALKQVEEYFTVLMYVLQLRFTSSGQIEKAGSLLLDAIKNGDTFIELRLRLLQMLYNSVESTLPLRATIYVSILEFAAKHGIFHTLVGIVLHVEEWMVEWSIDKKCKIHIFHIIAHEFDKLGKQDLAYKFWKKRVEFCDEPELFSTKDNIDATVTFCIRSLKSEDTLYFDQLLLMPAVSHLLSTQFSPLVVLLNIFIKGTNEDLEKYAKQHGTFLESLDLPLSLLRSKMSLLSLASLCQNESEVSIAKVQELLGISEEEAEHVIVTAITKGVLDALIDQKTKRVIIRSVMHREFSTEELKALHGHLLRWKSCLADIARWST
ncbi:PCI domain-containing protein [Theileria equi strain WA]|uniref:PCI domain-containing protein n=1 Tax=Theileria equi strain WA TaxID=1537102 RepID=L0B200_THEEQ|nr:PCI domain-containing protein [Theileria equi strain WA]AFZ81513.1 PCI domain-containing protein [Theileria equi strain WA]|eukprot:XP_004831179.1 PCI domain-containing protein [Theileria equi strain WA]